MLREPLAVEWLEAQECVPVPIPLKHVTLQPDQFPRLVPFRPQDVHVLQASVEAARDEQGQASAEKNDGFAIGGWLISEATPEVLAKHLASTMSIQLPNGGGNRYLRWADRRVLEWMWPVLDEAQRCQLLGPVARWTCLDRRGELVTYCRAEQAGPKPPLHLRPEQWTHAQDCQMAQDLLRGWLGFCTELPTDYLQQAVNALHGVRQLDIRDRQDSVLVGAYILQVHPRLAAHPTFVAAIDQALQQGEPLADALARIPDPYGWDAMRADLMAGHLQVPLAYA
ncbi:hypothetical protein CSC70_00185 [Pseudoxanthomonas kalamensis DSM 18571]|nr:hypothetical protein CSC70_00185 [Pseudoxanthomonas kalamensis DSM 18571]